MAKNKAVRKTIRKTLSDYDLKFICDKDSYMLKLKDEEREFLQKIVIMGNSLQFITFESGNISPEEIPTITSKVMALNMRLVDGSFIIVPEHGELIFKSSIHLGSDSVISKDDVSFHHELGMAMMHNFRQNLSMIDDIKSVRASDSHSESLMYL